LFAYVTLGCLLLHNAMRVPLYPNLTFRDDQVNATASSALVDEIIHARKRSQTAGKGRGNATSSSALIHEILHVAHSMQKSQSSHKGWCEIDTGGTCMFSGCNPKRGRTTCSLKMWCTCDDGWCSNAKGICHKMSESDLAPATGPAWVRKELHWVYYLAPVALIARADLLINIPLHLLTVAFRGWEKIPDYTFDARGSWLSERERYGYGLLMALVMGTAKLFFVHLPQPICILLAFYSYSPLMGKCQWYLAAVVISKEVLHLLVAFVGVIVSPHFLLFQPCVDTNRKAAVGYVTWPTIFIVECLPSSLYKYRIVLAVLLIGVCLIGDCGATLALLTGFGGVGTMKMWPGLAVGYCMAIFTSLPGLVYITFL